VNEYLAIYYGGYL